MKNVPGIYLFYNEEKELIYVGKATSLKSRVNSYFSGSKNIRPIEILVEEIKDIKTIETDSAIEAAILEGEYIKKYKPKYNIKWRDDKSWNYLYLTKEDFPKLKTVREHQLKEIDVKYIFGPYPGINTKEMLKILHSLFFVSRCDFQEKPCFDYQIKQCLGVCIGKITKQEYKKRVIDPLLDFLKGKKKKAIFKLEKQMKDFSNTSDFEEAKRIKIQIEKLKKIQDISLINKSFIGEYFSKNKPIRIEGYDISNLGNDNIVGSMVVFLNGEPAKSEYKKFKIKTLNTQNDVGALKEVLERRLKHLEWDYPDIFLVDGGLAQVNIFKQVLQKEKINIPVIGIIKGVKRDRNDFVGDVFKDMELLIKIRDEAHRFAIKYQRDLRKIE